MTRAETGRAVAARAEGAELLRELAELGTCALSDALDLVGRPGGWPGIVATYPGCPPVAGRAITVEVGPREPGAPAGAHLGTEAIELAGDLDLIIVSSGGRPDVSTWGGMLSEGASSRGVRAIVVDGACRDVEVAARLELPLYARGLTPTSAKGRLREIATNVELSIAGVSVAPGDYVVADANGVVVVPQESVSDVRRLARRLVETEDRVVAAIRRGAPASEAIHDGRIADALRDEE